MFKSLSDSMEEFLNGDNLKNFYEKGTISVAWDETVGSSISENTSIKGFKCGTLIIKTKTPVWRNELLFQKKDILIKLNKKLNKTNIKDIRFL